jgi:WD40 repeat protein
MGLPIRRQLMRSRASRRSAGAAPTGYDAFISYSHAVDRRLAPALQRALHRLAKPWYRLRALRVFRDDASLSANPNLWSSIEDALESSRFFILLASPESARSVWVLREIDYWRRHKPPAGILIALTDGVIVWDVSADDFDWDQTTALPRSLHDVFDSEPRWVDFSWARTKEHLSLNDPRFRNGVANLAAPLHGRAKDELFGEDVRQQRRTTRLVRTAIATLAALALATSGTAVVAVKARDLARTRQRIAEHQQRVATARGLVAQADAVRDSDPRTALLLGIAAQRIQPNTETQASLVNTLTTTHYAGTLSGHTAPVLSIEFSPDGRTLATGGADGKVLLWDLSERSGRLLSNLRLGESSNDQARSVAFSHDGRTLAVGAREDGRVLLWDVSDRTRPRRLGNPLFGSGRYPDPAPLAFAPDGVLAATIGRWVVLRDISNPARPRRLGQVFMGHQNGATSLVFAPDGRTLAIVGEDQAVWLWDVSDRRGGPVTKFRPSHSLAEAGVFVTFAPDGTLAIASGQTLALWDVSDRTHPQRLSQTLTGHHEDASSVTFAPNGHTLATASADHTVRLWDVLDKTRPRRLGQPFTGHHGSVEAVAFAPNGRTLATASFDQTVILWDVLDRGRPRRVRKILTDLPEEETSAVAFTPDGHALATTSGPKVLLWDVSDPAHPSRLGQALTGRPDSVESMTFTSDGQILAISDRSSRTVLWDVSDRFHPRRLSKPLRPPKYVIHDPGGSYSSLSLNGVYSVAFTRDGHTLAMGLNDGRVVFWDVSDPVRPRRLGQPLIVHQFLFDFQYIDLSVEFTPDGHTLLAGDSVDQTVSLWNVSDPARPRRLGQPLTGQTVSVALLAFAPDGHIIATISGREGMVLLWDISDPSRPRRVGQLLTEDSLSADSVAFATDRDTLATGGINDMVVLWDVSDPARPRRLGQPLAGQKYWAHVVFAPDGRTLATSGRNQTVQLWDLTELNNLRRHATERACSLTGRGLDPDEWARYVSGLPYQATCPG